jgi:hypothetical protein
METDDLPSVYIPFVYPNVSENDIRKVFKMYGEVNNISIIPKTRDGGVKYNTVIVNFRRWNNSSDANNFRQRLLSGNHVKLIYNSSWYWLVFAYPKNVVLNSKKISEKIREDSEIEHQNFVNERILQNRCVNCNRQKFGRFDTCCQACLSGSHTADCDKRNRVTTPYYMKKKGGKRRNRTNKKRARKNKSRKLRK